MTTLLPNISTNSTIFARYKFLARFFSCTKARYDIFCDFEPWSRPSSASSYRDSSEITVRLYSDCPWVPRPAAKIRPYLPSLRFPTKIF